VGHSGAVIGIEGVKATTLNGAGGNWRRADKRHALPSADFCNKIGTERTSQTVCYSVATGRKADMAPVDQNRPF
jgi:ribosomal protein L32